MITSRVATIATETCATTSVRPLPILRPAIPPTGLRDPSRRRRRARRSPLPRYRASRQAIAAFRPSSWVIRRNSSRAGRLAVSIITSSSVLASSAARRPASCHTRLIDAFIVRTTNGSFLAISSASAIVASSSSSRGTTRFTRPILSASTAGMRSSPVRMSSFAARTPTTHGRNIETTPEPNRMSTYPNTASSEASARSHASIRSVPPARQYECTDAMTGFGSSRIRRSRCVSRSSSRCHSAASLVPSSASWLRSYPAQNARPAPRSTTTRTSSS